MIVHVEGGRAVKLEGHPDHPVARGALCARTYRYTERVYSPERILHPLLRDGVKFRTIGWEEALDRIAQRLARLRAEARTHSLLHAQSAGSMALVKDLSARFFSLLGGVTIAEGDFCLGAGKTALTEHLGDYRSHSWRDLETHAGSVVLWGRNPFVSGPHRAVSLKAARLRGAPIVSINPVVVGPARLLDLHVPIRPGSDVHLAALLARVLQERGLLDAGFLERHVEEGDRFLAAIQAADPDRLLSWTGLSGRQVDELLALLIERRPTAILLGTGVIRHRFGQEAVGWIVGLAASLGNLGVPGGGVSFSVRHRRSADVSWLEPSNGGRHRPLSAGRWPRLLQGLRPPVDTLWVNGANPIAMLPDSTEVARALESIEFRVVCDFHMTDTARAATIVLPICSFLEEDAIVTSWGHELVGRQRRVIEPLGEARTDLWILQELAARLGFGSEMAGDELAWSRRLLAPVLGERQWREIAARGWTRNPIHEEVPYADRAFPRPGARCRLPDRIPDEDPLPHDPDYPAVLLTPKSHTQHLSQVVAEREPDLPAGRVSTDIAGGAGAPGVFSVRSRSGRILARLEEDPALPPGLVVIPLSGTVHRGTSVNLLTADAMAADGVTPAYYDARVRVEPMA